jgi:hypothetical protein
VVCKLAIAVENDSIRNLFAGLGGEAYELSVDRINGSLLPCIVDYLSWRVSMPLSYVLPMLHRICTGETLITRKHRLLGLNTKNSILQVQQRKERNQALKEWTLRIFIWVFLYRFRMIVLKIFIATFILSFMNRYQPDWLLACLAVLFMYNFVDSSA